MRVLFVFLMIAVACACQESVPQLDSQHPASIFLEQVKQADSTALALLLLESNWTKPQATVVAYEEIHLEALKRLKKALQAPNHQVYRWATAKEKFPEKVKTNFVDLEAAQEVVVILQDQQVFYLHLKEEKYHSMLPLSKGNVIIGWL